VKSGVEYCDRASVRAWLLAPVLRYTARPLADRWPFTPHPLRLLRMLLDARTAVLRPRRGTLVQPVVYERFAAEWIDASPVTVIRPRTVLYLHGGGFVAGSPRSHRGLVSRLSENAGGPILSVDYRHPPEAPVATAIDDCVRAYEWLLREGWAADQIVVAGDGAGGNLAFSTVQRLRDDEKPIPAGLVAMSGWFDLTMSADTIADDVSGDPLLSPVLAARCVNACVAGGDDVDPGVPWLSPVFARPDGLPPTLLQVGADERLRGDSELMAERLRKASVPCTLQLWRRQVHGFQALVGWLPDATRALAEIGAFVREVTAPGLRGGRRRPAIRVP
jgi:epsilon-lactone hydrolase